MYRPAALFIGLRYTRAKRRNHFISLISMVSLIGIALGVCVLITVLSVMNGFDKEIKQRVFSMIPSITISSHETAVQDWQNLQSKLNALPYVQASAPFVTGQVLLSSGKSVQPALLSGILPTEEGKVTEIANKMVYGVLTDLKPGEFDIVLGEELFNQLNANIGDKITVLTPQVSLSPAGVMPRFKRFTIVGVFKSGGGFGFDRALSFVHLNDAQKLLGLGNNVSGIYVKVKNTYAAPYYSKQIKQTVLNDTASVNTWADQFGEFFHAVQLEKTMMFIILLLIIAIAAFNLVSTLMMVVSEKESDIAILRTFGATPRMIMLIFICQGAMVGIFGTLLGVLAGVLLSLNVTSLVNLIQDVFNIQFLSSNVYFVNFLPSEVEVLDVIRIGSISLFLSLIATVYPAWRASKMDPVESLRYE